MYRALALAANLSIDHIRKLLGVAGNTFDPFDERVSLLRQDFTNMVIAQHQQATLTMVPTHKEDFWVEKQEVLKDSEALWVKDRGYLLLSKKKARSFLMTYFFVTGEAGLLLDRYR